MNHGDCCGYPAIVLPPYDFKNTRAWFVTIEKVLSELEVNDEHRRYFYTVHHLPIYDHFHIDNLLQWIPESDPYSILKAAVLQQHAKHSGVHFCMLGVFNSYDIIYAMQELRLERLSNQNIDVPSARAAIHRLISLAVSNNEDGVQHGHCISPLWHV